MAAVRLVAIGLVIAAFPAAAAAEVSEVVPEDLVEAAHAPAAVAERPVWVARVAVSEVAAAVEAAVALAVEVAVAVVAAVVVAAAEGGSNDQIHEISIGNLRHALFDTRSSRSTSANDNCCKRKNVFNRK